MKKDIVKDKRSQIIDKYLKTLEQENIYVEKYIKNNEKSVYGFEDSIEAIIKHEIFNLENDSSIFIWRTIKNKKDMEKIINSKDKFNLLRLSDFYNDELAELFANFFDIKDYSKMEDEEMDKLFSTENYKSILNNKDTPVRIKECIKLVLECDEVCEQLYSELSNE